MQVFVREFHLNFVRSEPSYSYPHNIVPGNQVYFRWPEHFPMDLINYVVYSLNDLIRVLIGGFQISAQTFLTVGCEAIPSSRNPFKLGISRLCHF